jgi:Undecaprenyl-phosphate galactose phosphotransferase WbaP
MSSFPGVALIFLAFLCYGLYPGVLLHPAEEIKRVAVAVTVVFFAFASMLFIFRSPELYSRSVFLVAWVIAAPIVLLGRYLVRRMCADRRWWGQSAVVLGSSPAAQRLIRSIAAHSVGIRVIGVLADEYVENWPSDLPPIWGHAGDASGKDFGRLATYIVVAVSDKSAPHLRRTIHESCTGFRHILMIPELNGICSLGIAAREVGGELGFELPQRLFHPGARTAKRTMDIVVCSLIILSLLPLFLVAWILVKITSPGPGFYGHLRYGQDGRIFTAWKFRTMVVNADQVLADHLRTHPEDKAAWECDHKLRHDPRVTAVGKWLRRSSLDELPQLWNVLRGEMSLVGPRPIVKAEIAKYGKGYELYTRVLPGISGLWQVSGRNNTTYQERVAFDEYYVRNWSIWLDTYILFRTIEAVSKGEGAY